MTSKQKAALRKAQRRSHTATAEKNRKKSRKANKNEVWSTNEQAFSMLMNGILSDASRKSHGKLQRVKITKVNEGFVHGNRIVLNCNVKNARGEHDQAEFIISSRPDGRYTINESSDFFDGSGLRVGGFYHVNHGRFVFDSMGYNLKYRGHSINESFKVVNDQQFSR